MGTEVRGRLQNVFRRVFDDPSINIDDAMTADDIEEWDSVMHINLLISIEQEFSVQFKTDEVMSIANVGQFISLLEKKLDQRSA